MFVVEVKCYLGSFLILEEETPGIEGVLRGALRYGLYFDEECKKLDRVVLCFEVCIEVGG